MLNARIETISKKIKSGNQHGPVYPNAIYNTLNKQVKKENADKILFLNPYKITYKTNAAIRDIMS